MNNLQAQIAAIDSPLQQSAMRQKRGFGARAADLLALLALAVIALAALLLFGASLFFSAYLASLENNGAMRILLSEQNALIGLAAFVAGWLFLRQIRRLGIT